LILGFVLAPWTAAAPNKHGYRTTCTRTAGREQFLLILYTSSDPQTRLGQKHCDEIDLLPLLLAHGVVCCVRTILIEVRPLGGDSLKITLDLQRPSVGEAKAEISLVRNKAHQRLGRSFTKWQ
jgi:hypothetical protein